MSINLSIRTIFVAIIVALTTICYIAFIIIQSKNETNSDNYDILRRFLPCLLAMLLLLFAGSLYTDNANYTPASLPEEDLPAEEDLSAKIDEIAKELSKSSQMLSEIQTELENRISIVEKLKEEADTAENMISLTKDQVNAIQSKLNQELEASSGKSLLSNILISTIFFFLGLIVQPIWNFFKKKTTTPTQQIQPEKKRYTDEEIERVIELLVAMENNK